MDETKAREFLENRGQLLTDALYISTRGVIEMRNQAISDGYDQIRDACQQQLDEAYAAIRELQALIGGK